MTITETSWKYPWRLVWLLSEWTGIGLGSFAPYVFEKMIGNKGIKIN